MRRTAWRLGLLARPVRGWMLLAALLGFLTVGSGVGLLMTSAYLISQAALRPSIAALQLSIAGVRFFSLARGLLRYLDRLAAHDATFRLLARVRLWFYQALEPLAPARLVERRRGDLLARAVGDVETLQHFYLQVGRPLLVALLSVGLVGWLLSRFAAQLTAVVLGFWLLVGLGLPWLTRSLPLIQGLGPRRVQARARLHVLLLDQVRGMGDLLVFGRARAHRREIAAQSAELVSLQKRTTGLASLDEALGGLLMHLAVLTALCLAVPLVHHSLLDGTDLAVVALGILASFEAVLPLPGTWRALEESTAAANRLFALVDARPAVAETETSARELSEAIPTDGLHFERVSFSYDGQVKVLDQITLEVPARSQVAVVGASGAGKTTLVNLLLRFWEYQEGQILIGGREVREWSPTAVRSLMSVVPQDPYLFGGTVRDNLLLARPSATAEELEAACRLARVHEAIASLPEGYDTWIGEQGITLSAGEGQRLVMARAFLQNRPILILDEPTARLDPLSELQVLETLAILMKGRTTLLITHRLIDMERMDRIYVLRGGRLVEQGTHRELCQRPEGYYRRLWDLQQQLRAVEESQLDGSNSSRTF